MRKIATIIAERTHTPTTEKCGTTNGRNEDTGYCLLDSDLHEFGKQFVGFYLLVHENNNRSVVLPVAQELQQPENHRSKTYRKRGCTQQQKSRTNPNTEQTITKEKVGRKSKERGSEKIPTALQIAGRVLPVELALFVQHFDILLHLGSCATLLAYDNFDRFVQDAARER